MEALFQQCYFIKTINPVQEVETNSSDENSDEGRVLEYIDLAKELHDDSKWT